MKMWLPKSKIAENGQVIIILLLVMLLALSVGLAITQRTTSDLNTSTQTEQSSRAFSAAEAGLEKALSSSGATYGSTEPLIQLGNDTTAQLVNSGTLPIPGQSIGIEYPPIGKETIAQFWLADPATPANNYSRPNFYVYFGNSPSTFNTTDNFYPAVEVNVITCQATSGTCTKYENQRFYYDSSNVDRGNGFLYPGSSGFSCTNGSWATVLNPSSPFYCRATISILNCTIPNCIPQAVRIRLLYANVNQKVGIGPIDGTSAFPPQVEIFTSKGKAGQAEKALQLFRVKEMIPAWMDFAIFSVNSINK